MGPTEAAIDVTCWSVPDNGREITTVPIGKPLSNVSTYVLDEHRQLVPLGVGGELYIGGVQVARGYLNQPDLTAERLLPMLSETNLGLAFTGQETWSAGLPTATWNTWVASMSR
jgi:non-ribosomal peptide synthetase component F